MQRVRRRQISSRAPWAEEDRRYLIDIRDQNKHLSLKTIQERYFPDRSYSALKMVLAKEKIDNTSEKAPDANLPGRAHRGPNRRGRQTKDHNTTSSNNNDIADTSQFIHGPEAVIAPEGTAAQTPQQPAVGNQSKTNVPPEISSTPRPVSSHTTRPMMDQNKPAVTTGETVETLRSLAEHFVNDINAVLLYSPQGQTGSPSSDDGKDDDNNSIAIDEEFTHIFSQLARFRNKAEKMYHYTTSRSEEAITENERLKEDINKLRQERDCLQENSNQLESDMQGLHDEIAKLMLDLRNVTLRAERAEWFMDEFREFSRRGQEQLGLTSR